MEKTNVKGREIGFESKDFESATKYSQVALKNTSHIFIKISFVFVLV